MRSECVRWAGVSWETYWGKLEWKRRFGGRERAPFASRQDVARASASSVVDEARTKTAWKHRPVECCASLLR